MNIFKAKNIKGKNFIEKIVNLVNMNHEEDETEDKLSKIELNFVKAVSKDMTEDEIEQLKTKVKEDNQVMKSYRKRSMLKDSASGKLLPKSSFAIDVDFPAREFRAIKSNS